METVFSLRNVSKVYTSNWRRRKVSAVENVSLEIGASEAVGFIGHNGAGKSTTIRLMLGLQMPTRGECLIFGKPALSPEARRGIAYLPERPLLYDYLTPHELLGMSLHLHGIREGVDAARCEWLSRLGLENCAHRRVGSFSKGMSQRVALAMAMCSKPKALVLDEPLSGLDPIGRREIVDLLEEYRRGGNTLFFSSHVLSDVERLADRFVFIHQGQIKATHDMASLVAETTQSYEIAFYLQGEIPEARSIGRDMWTIHVEASVLGREIDRLQKNNGILHSVRSSTTLEQIYIDLVKKEEETRR